MNEAILACLWVATMQAMHRLAVVRATKQCNELQRFVLPVCNELGWPEWGPAMRGDEK